MLFRLNSVDGPGNGAVQIFVIQTPTAIGAGRTRHPPSINSWLPNNISRANPKPVSHRVRRPPLMLLALKYIAVLVAAMIVGNSFLAELKKARALNLPWYRPYLSLPGIVIIAALVMTVIIAKFQ
jgi:hypothetical protein